MPTCELLGRFSGKLELFFQLSLLIDKVKTFNVDIISELKSYRNDLSNLICDSEIETKQKKQLELLDVNS